MLEKLMRKKTVVPDSSLSDRIADVKSRDISLLMWQLSWMGTADGQNSAIYQESPAIMKE